MCRAKQGTLKATASPQLHWEGFILLLTKGTTWKGNQNDNYCRPNFTISRKKTANTLYMYIYTYTYIYIYVYIYI